MFAVKDYGEEIEAFNYLRSSIQDHTLEKQSRTGDLICLFKDLMDKDEMIMDVIVFTEFRYFLTATDEGNIYVWKYVQSGKVETSKRLIHTYTGHSKAVTSISPLDKYPHLFTSVSLDGTVRIWSLEAFLHLYTLEVPGTLIYAKILSRSDVIVSQTAELVQVHRLRMILENYMSTESRVKQIMPGYKSLTDQDAGHVTFTASLCDDNSAFIRDIDASLGDPKTTLYPPPSAQEIVKI
jgi:WD40 repeat protein